MSVAIESAYSKVNPFQMKVLSTLVLIVLVMSLASLTGIIGTFNQSSVLYSSLILLGFGYILFRKIERKLFLISFLFNISIAGILAIYYLGLNRVPFIGGGDDELFYTYAVKLSKYWLSAFGPEYIFGMQYKLYVHLHGFWFDFLNYLGISDYLFFHSILLNCFVGALIGPLSYRIIKKIFYERFALYSSLLIVFFPLTVFYSATLLRESFVTVLFLIIVLVTISDRNFISKGFILFILLLLSYFLRPASAIFMTMFPAGYFVFAAKSRLSRNSVLLFFTALIFTGLAFKSQIYDRDIKETQKMYDELAQENSSESSIGMKLTRSGSVAVRAMSVLYIIYSPVPPPFFIEQRLDFLFLSLGSSIWYFAFPSLVLFFFLYYKDKEIGKYLNSFMLFFVFSAFIVTFSSADVRHLQPIYPLSLAFVLYFIKERFEVFKKYMYLYLFIIPFPIALYVIVKFILL